MIWRIEFLIFLEQQHFNFTLMTYAFLTLRNYDTAGSLETLLILGISS